MFEKTCAPCHRIGEENVELRDSEGGGHLVLYHLDARLISDNFIALLYGANSTNV